MGGRGARGSCVGCVLCTRPAIDANSAKYCEDVSMSLIQTIFAGLVGTIVLTYLQGRAAKYRRREELRQSEFSESLKIIEKLAEALDLRTQAHTRFWEYIKDKSADQDKHEKFIDAIDTWMGKHSSLSSGIYHYFGAEYRQEFDNIQGLLFHNALVMRRSLKIPYEKLSSRDRQEHDAVDAEHQIIRIASREFINRLNLLTSEGKFGKSQHFNDIYTNEARDLSRLYLARRLFNLT